MVQELIELRQSIVEGRYQDALEIVDELKPISAIASPIIFNQKNSITFDFPVPTF